MGRHRIQYSKEAIEAILKDLDSGLKIAEAAKKYGVSVPTLYDWRRVAKHMSNIEAGIEEGDPVQKESYYLKKKREQNIQSPDKIAELQQEVAMWKDMFTNAAREIFALKNGIHKNA